MGTKLLLLAVGVLAILGVLWLIRRSSKAADAAWNWADETLSDQINKVRDQMADATDPAKVASLRSIEASLLRKQAEALRP
jgi:Tfp pilus assembly protein PilV